MASSTLMHLAANPSFRSSPSSSSSGLNLQLTTSFQKQAFWGTTNADVEAHLISALPKTPPPVVYDPMRHLVLSTPKTMAPALCVTACELVGGNRHHAMAAAAALHLMLSAAYAHENLLPGFQLSPCCRLPDTRAGHFPPGVELLTGDGLYPLAYQLVVESRCDPGRLLRVVLEITGAMGPEGLIEGQHIELARKLGRQFDAGWVERVCEKKEGRVYACGAACGGILGGGSDEEVEKLRRFGLFVGTMHGLLVYFNGGGRRIIDGDKEEEEEERLLLEQLQVAAERLRCSALSELEGLEERGEEKDGVLSSLVDVCFEQGRKKTGSSLSCK